MSITRYPFREFTKVVWVPGWDGIADISAPTVAELTDAGNTDISCFLTADGLALGISTSKVTGTSLCDSRNPEGIAGVTSDPSLKGYRDSAADGDTLWNIAIRNSKGFLVVRRGIASEDAFTATENVEVYKATMGEPSPDPTADAAYTTFTLPLAFDTWDLKATVAAA